jgi:hypothetical protein
MKNNYGYNRKLKLPNYLEQLTICGRYEHPIIFPDTVKYIGFSHNCELKHDIILPIDKIVSGEIVPEDPNNDILHIILHHNIK